MLATTDVGNATQGQGGPDHQVSPIGGAQRVQAFCHRFVHMFVCVGGWEAMACSRRKVGFNMPSGAALFRSHFVEPIHPPIHRDARGADTPPLSGRPSYAQPLSP